MPNAPLKHVTGSTVTTVVDPRFGVAALPAQPSGWSGGTTGSTSLAGPLVSVDSMGAKGDGRDVTGVTITSGSATVSGSFATTDTGKTVWLLSGANVHKATISAATTGNLTVSPAPSFGGSGAVAVVGTDSSDFVADAVNAAKAFGAAGVQFGPGLYLTDQALPALTRTRDFRLQGASAGGMSYGYYSLSGTPMDTAIGTELRYLGSGTGTFINASYTRGFSLSKMGVRAAHPGFTGTILDVDHTWASYVDHFVLGGVWGGKNATVVKDTHTVETQFTDGMIERAAIGFDSEGATYCNANTYTRVVWLGCTTAMRGLRTQCNWLACVFEPTGGSMTEDPLDDVSPIQGVLQGCTFVGCGWWDAIASHGAWLRPSHGSAGIAILGGYYEPRTANEVLIQPDGTIEGLVITGLCSRGFNHTSGSKVIGTTGNINGLDYRANSHSSTTTSGLEARTTGIALEPDTGFLRIHDHGVITANPTLRPVGTQTMTLGGNVTLAFPGVDSLRIDLYVTQDATGGRTLGYPPMLSWEGGSAPGIGSLAGQTTHLEFTRVLGRPKWLGRRVGTYSA